MDQSLYERMARRQGPLTDGDKIDLQLLMTEQWLRFKGDLFRLRAWVRAWTSPAHPEERQYLFKLLGQMEDAAHDR